MGRTRVDVVLVPDLDHATEVHHGHAVGDVPHDREIVGDEDVGQAQLVLQLFHQVDHLRLDRHVQGRDRLVADEDLRVQRDASGDADALTLTAGELVRVAVDVLRVETHELEELLHPRPPLVLRHDVGVDLQGLGDDLADGAPRVERGVGVLEDDLDVPSQATHVRPRLLEHVDAVELDGALGRLLEPHEESPERGLATPRLADDTERLAATQLEVDAVDRADVPDGTPQDAALDRVVLLQAGGLEDDVMIRHRAPPC